jgi:hypothetical protein
VRRAYSASSFSVQQLASTAALILPTHTPGVRYSAVTQTTVFKTCRVGWTKTIRPPASYTNALKKKQLVAVSVRRPYKHRFD